MKSLEERKGKKERAALTVEIALTLYFISDVVGESFRPDRRHDDVLAACQEVTRTRGECLQHGGTCFIAIRSTVQRLKVRRRGVHRQSEVGHAAISI